MYIYSLILKEFEHYKRLILVIFTLRTPYSIRIPGSRFAGVDRWCRIEALSFFENKHGLRKLEASQSRQIYGLVLVSGPSRAEAGAYGRKLHSSMAPYNRMSSLTLRKLSSEKLCS